MSRKLILEVVPLLVAMVIVGAFALTFWLIMLIPYMIKPDLSKPITDYLSIQFTQQVAGMMTRGRRKQSANVG